MEMPTFKEDSTLQPCWPQDVGIIAVELYTPAQYVNQTELERFDGVSEGKYTVGLGQTNMGFCTDREDINSLSLTVVQNLMRRTGVKPGDIGRMEVGTETLIDKSKSVKTVLMQLFEESGHTDVEGIDTYNACYGGTNALFNSLAWVESSAWDGRYALVVAADIAVYASGNARCTGGAGAVAMLVGPNAPLVMERGLRASHMEHVYDFYKPDLASQYPFVDGKLSIRCYLAALDKCYERYRCKAGRKGDEHLADLDNFDYVLFHSPYSKLVQKSFARLELNNFLLSSAADQKKKYPGLEAFRDLKREDTYFNRDVEKAFMDQSKSSFNQKTLPTLQVAKEVGNTYTASLYSCLASLISGQTSSSLAGKRVLLFSYGSGLASSIFSLKVTDNYSPGSGLDLLCASLSDVPARLKQRTKIPPAEFNRIIELREKTHHQAPYTPQCSVDNMFLGTWFLVDVDDKHRRKYEYKSLASELSSDRPVKSALESKKSNKAEEFNGAKSVTTT